MSFRLLILSRSIPAHHLGGMELVAWDLAVALGRLGADVEICTTPFDEGSVVVSNEVKVRVTTVPGAKSGSYSRKWWLGSVAYARAWASRESRTPRVILGVGGGAHGCLSVPRENRTFPVVVQSHGTPWEELRSKWPPKSVRQFASSARNGLLLSREWRLQNADLLIPIGPSVERSLGTYPMKWLVGGTAVRPIHNGVDESQFAFNCEQRALVRSRLGISVGAPVVLCLNRLVREKGAHVVMEAFAVSRESMGDARLLIAGEGPARSELEALSRKLRIDKHVEFLGSVERDSVPDVLSAADVFAFTTLRREGLPIAPLEAAASGLPQVLSASLRLKSLHELYVDPADTQAVASALLKAVAQSRNCDRTSKLAEEYRSSNVLDRYYRTLERIAVQARRP